MSFTQTLIGMGAVGLVAQTLLSAVLPDPTGLVVHGLTYADGYVTQDRTVLTTEPAFYAQWAASVVDVETGDTVPQCTGQGAAPYPPGRKAVTFSLSDWTGNPLCNPLGLVEGKTYALRAVWSWGENSVSASQEFVR